MLTNMTSKTLRSISAIIPISNNSAISMSAIAHAGMARSEPPLRPDCCTGHAVIGTETEQVNIWNRDRVGECME